MTKEKLEEENGKLKATIAEQGHLVSAVDAKDAEISKLTKQVELLTSDLREATKKVAEMNHLAKAVESKDADLAKLSVEAAASKTENKKLFGEKEEALNRARHFEGEAKSLEEKNKRLAAIAGGYINNFRSMLKGLQGNLDVAIEVEALLSLQLSKDEKAQ